MGSEKLPVLNDIASATSHLDFISQIRALRIGKWSLNNSRLGSVTSPTRSSSTG